MKLKEYIEVMEKGAGSYLSILVYYETIFIGAVTIDGLNRMIENFPDFGECGIEKIENRTGGIYVFLGDEPVEERNRRRTDAEGLVERIRGIFDVEGDMGEFLNRLEDKIAKHPIIWTLLFK